MPATLSRRSLITGGLSCAICAAGGFGLGRLSAGTPGAIRPRGAQMSTDRRLATRTNAARASIQPDALFRAETNEPVVALTFDDGPDPLYTPTVLDMLKAAHVHATFFLVGVNARTHQDLVTRIVDEGHTIGNHTYDHRELELLQPHAVQAEINRGQRALVAAGAPVPTLFRPPKGYTDDVVGVLADAARFRTVFWDACVEHFVNHQSVTDGARQLLNRVQPGSVILAHDGGHITGSGRPPLSRRPTIEALPLVLHGLFDQGLEVVDVPTLVARSAATSASATASK